MNRILLLAACLVGLVIVVLAVGERPSNGHAPVTGSGNEPEREAGGGPASLDGSSLGGVQRRARGGAVATQPSEAEETAATGKHDTNVEPARVAIEGKVVTAEGVAACAGAQVVLWAHATGLPEEVQRTTSNDDGGFRFADVEPGLFTVVAAKIGEGRAALDVSTSREQAASPILLELSGARGAIERFVKDAVTRAPLAGVVVHDNVGFRTRTDDTGRFELPRPGDGATSHGVRLEAEGYLARAFLLDLESTDSVLVLRPTQPAAVRITGVSEGSSPTAVFLQPRDGMLDRRVPAAVTPLDAGVFLLSASDLAPERGTYCEVSAPGHATTLTRAYAWDPADTSGRSLPAVRLPAGRTVRLDIVDASNDRTLAAPYVARRHPHVVDPLDPTDPPACDEAQHERDATFGLDQMAPPASEKDVVLRGVGVNATCVAVAHAGYRTKHVALGAGESSLRIRLVPKDVAYTTIFGEVKHTDGEPVRAALVTALDVQGGRFSAVADEAGEFAIAGLFAGDYRLNVSYSQGGETHGFTLPGVYRPAATPVSLSVDFQSEGAQ